MIPTAHKATFRRIVPLVLDLPLLLSGIGVGLPGWPGEPLARRIVDLLRAGHIRLVADDRVLARYRSGLAQSELLPLEKERILHFILQDTLRCVSTAQVPTPSTDDACFAEVALTTGHPLVAADFRRFPAERCGATPVLSAIRFLEEFHRPASGVRSQP
ncbi:hypothetical protein SAMN05444156_1596 [Verrucomicrobium sp. GAS474]|uniref:hypothetical protein n=1 Tax=Verrucomicrobium sp. GAS474 TaxID=1882831 RepID=UPI00087C5430|nr:hypothetical protein [Verrucomicrobium sp. GAS474]SDU03812.1 hypothetical protein SAMN05444156_1596 [Verrucomicrobium sp. GAS474]